MTRKEMLVQLVAGLGIWTPREGKVAHAVALLTEIEKVCPEETPLASLGPQVFTPKHSAGCKDQLCNRSCMNTEEQVYTKKQVEQFLEDERAAANEAIAKLHDAKKELATLRRRQGRRA